jgi:hypothetical protein
LADSLLRNSRELRDEFIGEYLPIVRGKGEHRPKLTRAFLGFHGEPRRAGYRIAAELPAETGACCQLIDPDLLVKTSFGFG